MNNHNPSTMATDYSQETSACRQAYVSLHLTFVNSVIFLRLAPSEYNRKTSTRYATCAVSTFSSIIQTPTKYCLKLSNNHSCTDDISQLFFKSLLDSKILTGSSVNSSYSAMSFYASSVVKLKDWLLACGSGKITYNSAIHLVYSLSKQQKYLENNKLGFVCFNVDDIVVIDDSKFICVNPSLCEEIFTMGGSCTSSTARSTSSGKMKENGWSHRDQQFSDDTPERQQRSMTLCRPFNRTHCFCSPELLRMDSLPASVHYKTSYYSLGLLAVFCLFGYDGRCSSDLQQVYVSLQPILNTKLYFYLLRCLSLHSENRHLFFV